MIIIKIKSPASIIIIVLLVALIGVGVMIFLRLDNATQAPVIQEQPQPAGGRGTLVTSENVEEVLSKREEPVQDGYYTAVMSVEWDFDTWNSFSQNAYVENSTMNSRTVYFDLTLESTGDLIYTSPFIPVGSRLDKFALSKALSAGKYDAIVTYHLVDDNSNEITTVSVAIIINIHG